MIECPCDIILRQGRNPADGIIQSLQRVSLLSTEVTQYTGYWAMACQSCQQLGFLLDRHDVSETGRIYRRLGFIEEIWRHGFCRNALRFPHWTHKFCHVSHNVFPQRGVHSSVHWKSLETATSSRLRHVNSARNPQKSGQDDVEQICDVTNEAGTSKMTKSLFDSLSNSAHLVLLRVSLMPPTLGTRQCQDMWTEPRHQPPENISAHDRFDVWRPIEQSWRCMTSKFAECTAPYFATRDRELPPHSLHPKE